MSYKDEQKRIRTLLKPVVIKVNSPFRRKIKRQRAIDRRYTAPGKQAIYKDMDGEIMIKKIDHVINDYREQRLVVGGTNHSRMLQRADSRLAHR